MQPVAEQVHGGHLELGQREVGVGHRQRRGHGARSRRGTPPAGSCQPCKRGNPLRLAVAANWARSPSSAPSTRASAAALAATRRAGTGPSNSCRVHHVRQPVEARSSRRLRVRGYAAARRTSSGACRHASCMIIERATARTASGRRSPRPAPPGRRSTVTGIPRTTRVVGDHGVRLVGHDRVVRLDRVLLLGHASARTSSRSRLRPAPGGSRRVTGAAPRAAPGRGPARAAPRDPGRAARRRRAPRGPGCASEPAASRGSPGSSPVASAGSAAALPRWLSATPSPPTRATTSSRPPITRKIGLLLRSTTIRTTEDSAPTTGRKVWIGIPPTCPSANVGGAAITSGSSGVTGRVIRVGRCTSFRVMAPPRYRRGTGPAVIVAVRCVVPRPSPWWPAG